MTSPSATRRMSVVGLGTDPLTQMPIVLLQDAEGIRTLPIWIGVAEAASIATILERIPLQRPLTHDLFRIVMEKLGATLVSVELTELRENTFYALIHLARGEERLSFDARPSDALAMALRVDAPIFVAEEVLRRAREVDLAQEPAGAGTKPCGSPLTDEERAQWATLFEKMSPSQFKYRM